MVALFVDETRSFHSKLNSLCIFLEALCPLGLPFFYIQETDNPMSDATVNLLLDIA